MRSTVRPSATARVNSPIRSVARSHMSWAPSTAPLSAWYTTLMKPRSPRAMTVRPLPLIRYLPVLYGIPFSLHSASVLPTQAISGSVYTQAGTASRRMGGRRPAIRLTALIPWAEATWASWMLPLTTSPMAQIPATRVEKWRFTGMPPRSSPSASSNLGEKRPAVFGRRPVATSTASDWAVSALPLAVKVHVSASPCRSTRSTTAPVWTRTPRFFSSMARF